MTTPATLTPPSAPVATPREVQPALPRRAWPPARARTVLVILELAVTAGVLVPVLAHLRLAIRSMLATPLWTDELHSILHYSGEGVGTVLTTYAEPNNHILFNALNALAPGAGSVDPARARVWSVVFVLAIVAAILVEFFRRGWFLAGALCVSLVAANWPWLELALQARGYALQGLCAVVLVLGLWRYLEDPTQRWLSTMGVATVAGTWTIPNFALFAGGALLVLLVVDRTWRVFWTGVAAAAAIVAVHLPVVAQMVEAVREQTEADGRIYGLDGPAQTLDKWFLSDDLLGIGVPGWGQLLLLAGVGVVATVGRVAPSVRRFVQVTLVTSASFLASAVVIGSTVDRTTAFVVLPFAVASAALLGDLLHRPGWEGARLAVGVLAAWFITSVTVVNDYDFVNLPRERWEDAAAYIEETTPPGTRVTVTTAYPFLAAYFDDGDYLVEPPRPQRGWPGPDRGVLVEFEVAGLRDDLDAVTPLYAETRLPQRRGGFMRIVHVPPATSGVGRIVDVGSGRSLPALHDGDAATTRSLPADGPRAVEVEVAGAGAAGALFIAFEAGGVPRSLDAAVTTVDGRRLRLRAEDVLLSERSATLLVDEVVRTIDLVPRARPGAPVVVRDVWFVPLD